MTTTRVAALLLLALVTVTPPMAAAELGPSSAERMVADAANRERKMRGLPLLRWDDGLAAAAQEHAALMARKKTLSHQFPGERDLAGRVVAAGATFTALAENVALGPTAAGLHSQWMKSPPHRRNLLDAEFNSIGVGVVERDGQLYAVQDFSRARPPLTRHEQEEQLREVLKEQGVRILKGQNDAKEVCVRGRGYKPEQQRAFFVKYTTDDVGYLPEQVQKEIDKRRYHSGAVAACLTQKSGTYELAVVLFE